MDTSDSKITFDDNKVNVVVSQMNGVPSSNLFIIEQIQYIITQFNHDNIGFYNLVPNKSCLWFEFAKEIISQTKPEFNIYYLHHIPINEFPTKTKRLKNSILNNAKIIKWNQMFKYVGRAIRHRTTWL